MDYNPSIDHEDLESFLLMEPYQDYSPPKVESEDLFADYVPEECPITKLGMESKELAIQAINETIVLFKTFRKEIEVIPKHELKSLFPVVTATDELLEAIIKKDITCNSSLLECRDYLAFPIKDPFVYPENYIKGLKNRVEHSVMYLISKREILEYIAKYEETAKEAEARAKKAEAEADAERKARIEAEQEVVELAEQLEERSFLTSTIKEAESGKLPSHRKALSKPDSHKLPTTKLSRRLHELGECTDKGIRVSADNSKKEAIIFVSISYKGENFSLDRYEIAVINAVATLFDAGNTEVTSQDIARVTAGFNDTEFITISKREEIEKIIDKAIDTNIKIEYKQHLAMNKKGGEVSEVSTCDSKLIEARKVTHTIEDRNGTRKEKCYILLSTPPLYQYADAVNQMQSIPHVQYNTKGKIDSNKKNIVVKNYLFERIGGMKQKNSKLSRVMLYDTIAEKCGIDINGRTQKQRLRTTVTTLLKHFIETKFIESYEQNKKGNSIVSVTVEF